MNSYRYRLIFTVVLGLALLCVRILSSHAQSSESEEHLQLFFYSTDGPSHFIVIEKKHQRLKLFEQKDGLKLIKEFTCATGENPAPRRPAEMHERPRVFTI